MPEMIISNVSKYFGRVKAVDSFSLEVQDGELLTLLGPSGSGKSTMLRVIAGLEKPSDGEIRVGGRVVTSAKAGINVPPEKRGMGMVFQSYAIWPHMTVRDNIAFPLKVRKVPSDAIRKATERVMSLLELGGLGDRFGTQLSGGQQQRVALARALVFDPQVLLLDEPLSNLDAKLREQTRRELRSLQRQLGITAIFVTHDQSEAMMLSDRIAVMNAGRIQQLGTPNEIYEQPKTKFVMDFVGQANYLAAEVMEVTAQGAMVKATKGEQPPLWCVTGMDVAKGEEVTLCFRTHDIKLLPCPSDGKNVWQAKVKEAFYLGDRIEYDVLVADRSIRVSASSSTRFSAGDTVGVEIPSDCIAIWPS